MKLTLAPKDLSHLLKFKKSLKSDHKIIYDRGYPRLSITNKHLYSSLLRVGCIENKTFFITFPNEEILPKKLIRHFIRGYFDGDGCITFSIKEKYNYLYYIHHDCPNTICIFCACPRFEIFLFFVHIILCIFIYCNEKVFTNDRKAKYFTSYCYIVYYCFMFCISQYEVSK